MKQPATIPQLLKKAQQLKDAVGYEGLYKVDEFGNIYGFYKTWTTGRGTKRFLNDRQLILTERRGYLYANLCKDSKRKSVLVHRIVAKAFHPLSEFSGAQVNHIDGNKANNHYLNLEWCTPGDNQRHAFRLGLKIPSDNRKGIIQLSLNEIFIKEWDSLKSITDDLGFDRSAIIRVAKGKQQTSYGFKWKYKEAKIA